MPTFYDWATQTAIGAVAGITLMYCIDAMTDNDLIKLALSFLIVAVLTAIVILGS